ncbi:MAG: hypothetical protein WAU36_00190 [Cyclobacteriaceae bacterium]
MVTLRGVLLQCLVLVLFVGLTSNCVEETDPDAILCTDPLFPYLCPSAGKCCSLPFYGKNLNKCYGTISECGASGQSCESCGIEVNNTTFQNFVYANWDCDGSTDCETKMGAPTGTAGPFCDSAACQAWGDEFIPAAYSIDDTPKNTPSIGSPPDGLCFKVGDF